MSARIILQPSGNADAREHYQDTINKAVPLESIAPFLDSATLDRLRKIYPSGNCLIWGVTPAGSNLTKWKRISAGDVTLFSRNKRIYASATSTHKTHNKELAAKLWGYNSSNETWEYIYFLDELRRLDITYEQFNSAVGYAKNYIIQGFNVLDEDKSSSVLHVFDLFSDTYTQEITKQDFTDLQKKIAALEATEREVVAWQRLEQGYLKKQLFGNNSVGECACCGQALPVSMLVTAHIKKRSLCTERERLDLNVVFPMCKLGCDELFEKGYIAVKDGLFVPLKMTPMTERLSRIVQSLAGRHCNFYDVEKTKDYFDWHIKHHGG